MHFEAFGQTVNRQHAAVRIGVILVKPLDLRVRKLPATGMLFRFAGKEHDVVVPKFLDHPRLIEPDTADESAVALQEYGRGRFPRFELSSVAIDDPATNRAERSVGKLIDARNAGQIEHIARKTKEQVFDGVKAQSSKKLGPLRSNPSKKLNGCLKIEIRHKPA